MRSPRLLPLAPALLLAAACADPTALDLSLVPDPNVQSETQLVSRLVRLRLVVDSPEGLYPKGPSRREGEIEIVDLDGDGMGELSARVELGGLGRLPLIRLERGGMPSLTGLELRLDGYGPDDSDGKTGPEVELAAGGVPEVAFSDGEISPLPIPFNLRTKFRPPRVTQVFPEDGATLSPSAVGSVLVIFSKPMSPASLKQGVLQVLSVTGGSETPLALREIVLGELYAGGPTSASLRLQQSLGAGSYRVRVGQGALDSSGRALDQVPIQAGNQPFVSEFTLGPETQSSAACAPGCEASWCANGGTACPEGSVCDAASRSCLPTSCPKACAGGAVCDPARAACVEDCRPYGSYGGCADPKQRCDQASGLCL